MQHAQPAVRIQHRFEVPVDRLFRAWSDSVDLAQWAWGSLGHSVLAEVDFKVGGSFRLETQRPDGNRWSFSGRYTEITSQQRIAHTLEWQAPMGYDPVAECITVSFQPDGADTIVEFVHEGVPDEKSATAHARGWRDTFESLAAYLKQG